MPTGLKQRPEEQARDEELNPSERIQHDRVRDYEQGQPHHDRVGLSDDESDAFDRMTGGRDMDDLRNLEKNPSGPDGKDSKSGTLEANNAEESPWETSVGEKSGGSAKSSGNPYKRYGIIGGILAGSVGLIGGGIFGLFNFLFINLKEISYESSFKRSYTKTAQRSAKTMKKTYFANVDDCTGVRCRYRAGVTMREVQKLQRMGVTVKYVEKRNGRAQVTSMQLRDGTELNADNFEQQFKEKASVRAFAARARDINGTFPRTVSSLKMMYDKLNLSRKNFLEGKNDPDQRTLIQRLRERTMRSLSNLTARVRGQERENEPPPDTKLVSSEIQEAATELQNELKSNPDAKVPSDIDVSIEDVEKIAKGAGGGALRGGLRGVSIIGALSTACDGYALIKTLDIGAKVLIALNLIRYASVFMSFADATKAGSELGKVTPGQVAAVANMALKEDSKGRNFFDAPLIQYILYGKLPDASSFSPYVTGAVFAGFITTLRQTIDRASGGNAAEACGFINHPVTQVGAAAVSILLAIGTFGVATLASAAFSAASGATIGVLESFITPQLIKMAAGAVVTGDENGYDMANAIMAGMFAFAPQLSRTKGLIPLKKSQIAADTKEVNEMYYDFFPEKKRSPIDNIALNAGMFAAKAFTQKTILTQPQTLLASVGNIIRSPEAYAVNAVGHSDYCKDPDYEGFATTPTCALIYSEPTSRLEDPKFAPEKVCEFMLGYDCNIPQDKVPTTPPDNAYIDNAGNPVPTTDTNNKRGERYANYVEVCMDGTTPLLDAEIEGVETEPIPGSIKEKTIIDYCTDESDEKTYWRYWRMDGDLIEDPEEVDKYLNEPASAATAAPNANQTVAVGSTELFIGNFDQGNFGQWETCQWKSYNSGCGAYGGQGYVASIVPDGPSHETAGRFEVRPGDEPDFGGERSEVRAHDAAKVREGDERQYEFSLNFPAEAGAENYFTIDIYRKRQDTTRIVSRDDRRTT